MHPVLSATDFEPEKEQARSFPARAPATTGPTPHVGASAGRGRIDIKSTTCYMCACRCGIKVHLDDGRIRYIEGNRAHPVNRGVICAKGAAGIMQQASPARLSKPLLRVGERGRAEFREIEWDEALRIACPWLGPLRAQGPE